MNKNINVFASASSIHSFSIFFTLSNQKVLDWDVPDGLYASGRGIPKMFLLNLKAEPSTNTQFHLWTFLFTSTKHVLAREGWCPLPQLPKRNRK